MNHHVFLGCPDIPHVDALFEMHKPDWFQRKEIEKSQEYWEWLQQPHPYPIYMQEVMPEVPASVRYPYEEIVADLFPRLLRADEINPYFTSSFSFLMAMAIHQRFERVELYGLEMATNTEYAYQKPGGEFMIGLAVGRGIEVALAPNSQVCKALVYGYQGVPFITRERLEEIHAHFRNEYDARRLVAEEAVAKYNASQEKDKDGPQLLDLMASAQAYEGAWKLAEFFLNRSDYYISRQQLEIHLPDYVRAKEAHKGNANVLKGEYDYLKKRNGGSRAVTEKWAEYLAARANMYANMGAVQTIQNLMRECDLVPIKHDLVITIQDL